MIVMVLILLVTLISILISAQGFSNGLEYLGHRLQISEGVTGSIFAAIATALPETSVPLLAIFAGTNNPNINEEISTGAILGAPLMLATLSMCCMAVFVISKRGLKGYIHPEKTGYKRDINFFLLSFLISVFAMAVSPQIFYLRLLLSCSLLSVYGLYLYLTIKSSKNLVSSGHGVMLQDPLYFTKFGLPNNLLIIFLQLLASLGLLIISAKGFIHALEQISTLLKVSALILSFIIVPIATELPEKVNSILWVRRHKDTLGVGNITGALVFQNSILPAMGILLTSWKFSSEIIPGLVITGAAGALLRFSFTQKGIPILMLLGNGILYITYLIWILY